MIKSILYGSLNPIRAIVRSVLDNNRCIFGEIHGDGLVPMPHLLGSIREFINISKINNIITDDLKLFYDLLLRGVLVFSFRGKYCVASNDKIILK